MNMNVPALCVELKVHVNGDGTPVVNSRDVAEAFEKRHDHVLRDIEALGISPELGRSWFRPSSSPDSYGREQPSFNLTRQGFTLLVMGWNGERAMQFKVRYIQAFDEMEELLKASTPATHNDLIQSIREIVAPLAVRFDGQDQAIERIETRQNAMAEDIGSIKLRLFTNRRRISEATRREHVDANRLLGGRCQCCGENDVICDGVKSRFAEFDHFYQASYPDADHTWMPCKPCHTGLTTGRIARDKVEAHFRAYQEKRRRLPGRQTRFF
jgi:Rha family phage regulatory protein